MYDTEIFCPVCKQTKTVWVCGYCPTICHECEREQEETKKAEYLSNLKNLTLEDRISRLEEIRYDQEHTRPPPEFDI